MLWIFQVDTCVVGFDDGRSAIPVGQVKELNDQSKSSAPVVVVMRLFQAGRQSLGLIVAD